MMAGKKYWDVMYTLHPSTRDNLRGQKSLGPLKMSLEMALKVIVPPKKNYIPQFLKQRDINSYKRMLSMRLKHKIADIRPKH